MNGLVKCFSKFSLCDSILRTANHSKYGWKPNNFCYIVTKNFNSCRSISQFNKIPVKSSCRSVTFYSTGPSETEISLAKVLEKEIIAEQDLQKTQTIPSKIDDFEVALNGAEVIFTKQLPNETIKINFSVNNSIENVSEHDVESSPELKSKPVFSVMIETSQGTLELQCSFLPEEEVDEEINDHYTINEICFYKGDKSSADYTLSSHLLDYDIYNLLMDWLDEKGITNNFVQKLSEFSSTYEHNLYISILSELRKFVSHSEL